MTRQRQSGETMSNRLSGKVSIVTGTGGGIGREAALTFAREGALLVGCGLYVSDAEATVVAVRAAGGRLSGASRFCGAHFWPNRRAV